MDGKFLLVVSIVLCSTVSRGKTENSQPKDLQEESVDRLRKKVMHSIPTEEKNDLLSQMLDHPFKTWQNTVNKKKKIYLKASPSKEEHPTKKSLPVKNPVALDIALMKSNVYLTNMKRKGNTPEPEISRDISSAKRFKIPKTQKILGTQPEKRSGIFTGNLPALSMSRGPKQTTFFEDKRTSSEVSPMYSEAIPMSSEISPMYSEATPMSSEISPMYPEASPMSSEATPMITKSSKAVFESRAKRLEDDVTEEQSPTADSVTDGDMQTNSLHQYNRVEPAGSVGDQEVSVRSGVNAGRVVTVLPEIPVVMYDTHSNGLASSGLTNRIDHSDLQELPSSVPGEQRSTFPITRLIEPLHRHSVDTTSPVMSTQVEKLLTRFQGNPNDVTTAGHQHGGLRFVTQSEEENPVIKLAQVPVHVLSSNNDDTAEAAGKNSEKAKETSQDINEDTLQSLQLKLTGIISQLEGKVKNKKEKEEKEKVSSTKKTGKGGANEKSLKVLKAKLSAVLKKFKAKSVAGQPFTIGKEWSHLLDQKRFNQANHLRKDGPSDDAKPGSSSLNQGSWPSIASQLLRKLNKALVKLQEKKEVRALEKNAVMYFDFDNKDSTKNYENLIPDQSGHLNDATLSNRAHISLRTYGSCGKALILNSGNLRYIDGYLKAKQPTKAISLAMWVRTNATGYVKWFARTARASREFVTSTQYPLVRKNVWTHLCGTFNSSTGITRIYVDGELNAEKVNMQEDGIPADFTPAGIGSMFGDDNLIAVDEVYMFSRALSETEVQDLYDNCEFNRMVLHYGFQKINRTAGVVFDQSGLNNDAQLKGDANILDGGCEKCGSCLDLSAKGTPRLMIQGNSFKHRPAKAISLAAWFNLNSTTGTHPLLEVTEPLTKSPIMDLHVTDGKLAWKARDKYQNAIFALGTEQSVIPEGIWVHVLVTFDSVSGFAKIFVNGHEKALAKSAKKVPIGRDWGEVLIGGRSLGSQDLGGYMDELVMYNWELDASEISYVMKYCPDHPKLVSFTVDIPLK